MAKKFIRVLVFFAALLSSGPVRASVSIPFTITLSEAATVTGTPRVAVDVGGTTRYAVYSAGSGTDTLTFTLSPQAGDVDLDGVTVSSPIDLNGGAIKDLAGNDLTPLTFIPPNTSGIKIDYPSLGMDFVYDADGRYTLNGTAYNDLTSFLGAAGGTFTRASIGTYYDSSGTLQTAASGVPRFDWDPVTHAAKGILIEESRTNAIKYSEQIDNALWSKNNATISVNTIAAPDGTFAADKLVENAATNKHAVQISATGDTVSVYAKAGERTILRIDQNNLDSLQVKFNLSAGTVLTAVGATSSGIISVGNGWYRCWVHWPSSGTISSFASLASNSYPASYAGDGASGLYIWGAQLEQGAYPTSYIPTTTAAVTRAADSLYFSSGAALTQMQSSTGAFAVETNYLQGGAYSKIISSSASGLLEEGDTTSRVGTNGSGGPYFLANLGSGTLNATLVKSAVSWSASTRSLGANGGSIATSTGTMASRDAVYVGSKTALGNYINGYIKSLRFYPLTVSDAQLQLLTQ